MRVVVCGTGTGVGKTYVACGLARGLVARGWEVRALKPVESGWDEESSDARRLGEAGGAYAAPAVTLRAPLSPHLAARLEGRCLRLSELVEYVDRAWGTMAAGGWLLVETAGGLMTPLAPGVTNLDLLVALEPDAVVLVAADRLGSLHDVGATLAALRGKWADTPLVVVSDVGVKDASVGGNAGELVLAGVVRSVVEVGHGGHGLDAAVEALVSRAT